MDYVMCAQCVCVWMCGECASYAVCVYFKAQMIGKIGWKKADVTQPNVWASCYALKSNHFREFDKYSHQIWTDTLAANRFHLMIGRFVNFFCLYSSAFLCVINVISAFFLHVCALLFLFDKMWRFIKALDYLDNRVEKLRKESMTLTEKRDILLMSMDILKHNELLGGLNECKSKYHFCSTLKYLFPHHIVNGFATNQTDAVTKQANCGFLSIKKTCNG